jgi:Ca2+-binding RTX toxin-like protein
VIGPASCPSGGEGNKVGTSSAAGPAYLLNGDGSSCYGQTAGRDNALASDIAAATTATDTPIVPAVGNPAFGAVGAGASAERPSFVLSAIGLFRALDLLLPEYQGGQDLIGAWDPSTGQFRANYPRTMNDLQFLTGPSIADIDGKSGEEVLEGSSSADLAAYTAAGQPASGWPKLSTDWTVATPLVGTYGTRDTQSDSRKVVIGITRSGYVHAYGTDAPACSPSSSPRFHHDNANSGDYSRDAVLPGVPMNVTTDDGGATVKFRAPGDDLLCGRADRFQLATADREIDAGGFRAAEKLPRSSAPDPRKPGTPIRFAVPAGAKRFLAIRAVDEQGNVGRPVSVRVKPDAGGGGKRCGNRIAGTRKADRLRGTGAGDRIGGGAGNDRIKARGGDDCVAGGKGNDRAAGDGGDDRVKGGDGNDKLKGGGGADRMAGGKGRDRVGAGGGSDRVKVRDGKRDRVSCGAGKDRVVADRRDKVAKDCEKVKLRR